MTAPRDSSGSYQDPGRRFGRDFRLITGMLLILLDLLLVYLEHVHAIPPAAYTTPDVIMHLGLLVGGLLLMDPKRTLDLIGQVKDKIPGIGSKP